MEQQEKLMEAMRQSANLLHRSFHVERMRDVPLRHGQWRLLNVLYKHNGAALKELVEFLDIRPSSAGELVDKLEREGYAERRQDEDDKRVIRVYLTQNGREQAQTLAAGKQDTMRGIFSGLLEDEQAHLLALLEKLNASLRNCHDLEADDARRMHGHGPHGHGGSREHHGPGCSRGGHGCRMRAPGSRGDGYDIV